MGHADLYFIFIFKTWLDKARVMDHTDLYYIDPIL